VRKILIAVMSYSLMTCATFSSVGWIDMPDGRRLKAVKLQSYALTGTDTTLTMVYNCPPENALAGSVCVKEAEFGGASAAFLKALTAGAGAGAAIGYGIKEQEPDRTNINTTAYGGEGRGVAVQNQFQSQLQKQQQLQLQKQGQRQNQSMPMPMMGAGD